MNFLLDTHSFLWFIAGDHRLSAAARALDAAAVADLPFHHRDPFDRLLVGQARVEGMPIVSEDAAFDAYGVTRLW